MLYSKTDIWLTSLSLECPRAYHRFSSILLGSSFSVYYIHSLFSRLHRRLKKKYFQNFIILTPKTMGSLKIVMKMMTVTTINCDISWENSKLDFHRQLKNEGAILVYLCTYFLSFQFIFKCLAALNIWKYVYRPAIFWNSALFRQQNETIQFKLH